jgi:hypothetical protein
MKVYNEKNMFGSIAGDMKLFFLLNTGIGIDKLACLRVSK